MTTLQDSAKILKTLVEKDEVVTPNDAVRVIEDLAEGRNEDYYNSVVAEESTPPLSA